MGQRVHSLVIKFTLFTSARTKPRGESTYVPAYRSLQRRSTEACSSTLAKLRE